ncbi:hypothetical protein Smp_169310 [Schistosoma mansoni]|uniref:Structural protein n=1 Tax=Schistosoma mansoni TaxID=6183 RepID=G4VKM0_SCHMA|nr:hypothetical protein Smp_169310 [Schistosoma mansoni]|eukprot:XP_018652829.1 hypothetical protein Smp_169310 [Schistosoma mansoni]
MGITSDSQNTLSVYYINSRSLINKTFELNLTVNGSSPNITGVTETWLTVNVNYSPVVEGYICIRSDGIINLKGGDTILYVGDHFGVTSTTPEVDDIGTCEIA